VHRTKQEKHQLKIKREQDQKLLSHSLSKSQLVYFYQDRPNNEKQRAQLEEQLTNYLKHRFWVNSR